MSDTGGRIDEEAFGWAMRTAEPDFDGWEAFTAWLEADPRHARHYHLLQADAAELAAAIPAPPAADVETPGLRRRWVAGALAASLAAVVVGYSAVETRSDPFVVETSAGARRLVQMADGSSIALNGDTRLTLDHKDERYAVVERGEALFTVRHDPARPFKVRVGGDELVDVGTVFDVVRSAGATWVGVAEGTLIFNPHAEAVTLPAGRALSVGDRAAAVQLSEVAPAAVGGWRQGRLEFAGAPLSEVAAALTRALGTRFTVSPAVANRGFRGTIALDGLAKNPARLAPLLGVAMRRTEGGWEFAPLP